MKAILALIALLATFSASAGQHFTASLLNAKSVVLTNNATVVPTDHMIYTNNWGILATNGVVTSAGITNGSAFGGALLDGELVSEAYAASPVTLNIRTTGRTASATNVLTVVVVRSYDGVHYGSTTSDRWSVATLPPQSDATVADYILMTNMPAAFFVGTRGVAVYSIASSTSGGTNDLKELSLSGTFR